MAKDICVLYAEDNAQDADLTRQFFNEAAIDIKIQTVPNAGLFLECVAGGGVDVLLLDNHLPDMDGLDVLKALARAESKLPVVMVTGIGDEELVVQALKLGASDYVPKSGDYITRLPDIVRHVYAENHNLGRVHHAVAPTKRRVLYVEHNPMDIDLTVAHFSEAAPHITIETAQTPDEAIRRLTTGPVIDLVLTDLRVAGLRSLDFLHDLKHHAPDIQFIVITGRGDEETAIAALKLGAYDYVVKRDDYLNHLPYIVDSATLFAELGRARSKMLEAYDATLAGWGKALELRDLGTTGHTHRVAEMTVKFAKAVGIDDVEHIRRGALLHDIGKIGIPDHILLKPASLSEEEWLVMRMHPKYAYDWLSKIDFLEPALAIPWHHHERWDGNGYPDGLSGESIPLECRLFALIDVWDALRSERPYRGPWSSDQAAEYLRKESGTHFDPDLVETFLELFGSSDGYEPE